MPLLTQVSPNVPEQGYRCSGTRDSPAYRILCVSVPEIITTSSLKRLPPLDNTPVLSGSSGLSHFPPQLACSLWDGIPPLSGLSVRP